MDGMAFKRIYVDIPPDTHEALKEVSAERGMSQKALVAELIDEACKPKPARKKRSKKGKK